VCVCVCVSGPERAGRRLRTNYYRDKITTETRGHTHTYTHTHTHTHSQRERERQDYYRDKDKDRDFGCARSTHRHLLFFAIFFQIFFFRKSRRGRRLRTRFWLRCRAALALRHTGLKISSGSTIFFSIFFLAALQAAPVLRKDLLSGGTHIFKKLKLNFVFAAALQGRTSTAFPTAAALGVQLRCTGPL